MKAETLNASEQFSIDTDLGLSSDPKYLKPKYFYNEEGSKIFQEIMNMPEYYLTNSEIEIFEEQSNIIINEISKFSSEILLIELGSGDGVKTDIFIQSCIDANLQLKFMPIDISIDIMKQLISKFEINHSGIELDARVGDYFEVMQSLTTDPVYKNIPKLILFLGSNIGNFSRIETEEFIEHLKNILMPNDHFLIGYDLKKNPEIILKAYNDRYGITKRFNTNHLLRINQELGGDFDIENMNHHVSYDPNSGEVKSFLIANKEFNVSIKDLGKKYHFHKWESIYMECSRKYSTQDMNSIARKHGFEVVGNYFDRNKFFCNSLWRRK